MERVRRSLVPRLPGWVFLAALVPRLLLFAGSASWQPDFAARTIHDSDAHEYDALARTILQSGRFASAPDGPPEALRTPGYPAFLAAFYGVFGEIYWIPLLAQILLDAATAALLCVALRLRFPDSIAATAGFLYAFEPAASAASNWLLSDTLFLHLLVLGLYALLRWSAAADPRPHRWLVWAAVAWALAAWVRPPALYLAILLVPAAYLAGGLRQANRTAKALVLALVTFGALVAPWVGRNWIVFGTPGFSVSGAYNLLALYVTPVELQRRQKPYHQVKRELVVEADSLMRADGEDPALLNPFEKVPYWKRHALHYIEARPVAFGLTTAEGIVQSFLNLGTQSYARLLRFEERGEFFHTRSHHSWQQRVQAWLGRYGPWSRILAGIVALHAIGILVGGLAGVVTAWRQPPPGVWVLLFLLTAYFLAASAGAGLARYRLPAVPFYLPFVAAGWIWLAGWPGRFRQPSASRRARTRPG